MDHMAMRSENQYCANKSIAMMAMMKPKPTPTLHRIPTKTP
jgi:hypothetical protein